MPKKDLKDAQPVAEPTPVVSAPAALEEVEEVLVPFSVIIDGQNRTILAKDQEDLQRRIARIRLTSPTN